MEEDSRRAKNQASPSSQIVEVTGSVFTKRDTKGDFLWMIKKNAYPNAVYVFNDNVCDHNSAKPGGGNAAIRPYNRHGMGKLAKSAGICTGDKSGGRGGRGFGSLSDKTKRIIDGDIGEIRELLATGNYKHLIYSAEKGKPDMLGTGTFQVGLDVKRYIVEKLKEFDGRSPRELQASRKSQRSRPEVQTGLVDENERANKVTPHARLHAEEDSPEDGKALILEKSAARLTCSHVCSAARSTCNNVYKALSRRDAYSQDASNFGMFGTEGNAGTQHSTMMVLPKGCIVAQNETSNQAQQSPRKLEGSIPGGRSPLLSSFKEGELRFKSEEIGSWTDFECDSCPWKKEKHRIEETAPAVPRESKPEETAQTTSSGAKEAPAMASTGTASQKTPAGPEREDANENAPITPERKSKTESVGNRSSGANETMANQQTTTGIASRDPREAPPVVSAESPPTAPSDSTKTVSPGAAESVGNTANDATERMSEQKTSTSPDESTISEESARGIASQETREAPLVAPPESLGSEDPILTTEEESHSEIVSTAASDAIAKDSPDTKNETECADTTSLVDPAEKTLHTENDDNDAPPIISTEHKPETGTADGTSSVAHDVPNRDIPAPLGHTETSRAIDESRVQVFSRYLNKWVDGRIEECSGAQLRVYYEYEPGISGRKWIHVDSPDLDFQKVAATGFPAVRCPVANKRGGVPTRLPYFLSHYLQGSSKLEDYLKKHKDEDEEDRTARVQQFCAVDLEKDRSGQVRDGDGLSLLYHAAHGGSKDAVKKLLDARADPRYCLYQTRCLKESNSSLLEDIDRDWSGKEGWGDWRFGDKWQATESVGTRNHKTFLVATFKPGKIGIRAVFRTGEVTKVIPGGQGDSHGVQTGMFFYKIDGKPYSEAVLDSKIAGSEDFKISFKKAIT